MILVAGIPGLIRYLNEGHDLILLCQCAWYNLCHLSEIVKLLQIAMPEVEVILPTGQHQALPILPIVAAGQRRSRLPHLPEGSRVYVQLKGQKVPGIVLETAFSPDGDYLQVRLRVAQQNAMTGQWLVSDLPKPVQSYKVTKRATTIPALDDVVVEVS